MSNEHEVVLDIVHNRTEPGIKPFISHFDLVGRSGLAGLGMMFVPDLIDDLVRTDHLVQWPSNPDEGRRADDIYLTLPDEDRLQRWAKAEGESEDTNTELLGWINTTLTEVREGQYGDDA